jgi:hypothetical protein
MPIFFFQEEEEGEEEEGEEEEIVDLSLYMYIQSISRLRAKSIKEKDVVFLSVCGTQAKSQKGKRQKS